jgi:CHAT domain-containing protein/tetratricopeptide (TPR) repeat protein
LIICDALAHNNKSTYDILYRQGNYNVLIDSLQKNLKIKSLPANDYIQYSLLLIECYQSMGRIADAERYLENIYPIVKGRYEDFNYERDYYLYKGMNARKLMHLAEAETYYKKAYAIDKKRNLKLNFITDYRYFADLAFVKDEFDKAIMFAKKGISWTNIVHTANQDSASIAQLYNTLGMAYYLKSYNDSAAFFLNKALETGKEFFRVGNMFLSRVYYNYGIYYESLSDHRKARNFYLQAYKNLNFYKVEYAFNAEILGALGYNEYMLKNYESAIYYYNNDLEITKKFFGPYHPDIAWGYQNLGLVYTAMKNYDAAQEQFNKSLNLRKNIYSKNHHIMSFLYTDMANLYLKRKEYDKSLDVLSDALKIEYYLTPDSNTLRLADIYLLRANVYGESNKYTESNINANLALKIYDKLLSSTHSYKSRIYYRLAANALAQDKYTYCVQYVNKALQNCYYKKVSTAKLQNMALDSIAFDEEYLKALLLKANLLQELYVKTKHAKLLEYALQYYYRATHVLKKLRNSYAYDDLKLDITEQYTICNYRGLEVANTLYQISRNEDYLDDAYYFAENNKATLLLNQFLKEDLLFKNKISLRTLDYENELSKKINYCRILISSETAQSSKTDSLQLQLATLLKAKRKFHAELEQKIPEYYHLRYGEPIITLPKTQRKLKGSHVILHYTVTEDYTYIFEITRNKVSLQKIPNEKLLPLVYNINAQLGSHMADSAKVAIEKLGNILMPLSELHTVRKMIVIPDPQLISCPSEYLQYNKFRTFVPTIYNSSVTLYFKSSQHNKIFKNQLSAIAPVKFNKPWQELPNTINELSAISKYFKANNYTYQFANKSNILKSIAEDKILHIATHTHIDTVNPLKSYFQLFNKDSMATDTTRLYMYEVYEAPLNTNLAVLSTCNSGVGKLCKGEGITSIASAFNSRHCSDLVFSLWSANDQSTTMIMDKMYFYLSKRNHPYEALYLAKKDYLESVGRLGSNPYYWAGFICYGNQHTNYYSMPNVWKVLAITILGSLFLLFVMYFIFVKNASKL